MVQAMRTSFYAGWLGIALVACGGSTARVRETERVTTVPAPQDADALADAELPSPCSDGRLRLHGGAAEYPSTIGLPDPGSLELTPVGTMDLDGDGTAELIAYVRCMPGGSGTNDSVHAYHVENGAVVEVASIEGGDRAAGGLDGARLENGAVVVGRFSGEEEGLCCPTHVTDETWRLQHGQFVRTRVGETRSTQP
jgi:hypothetical protein